MSGTAKGCPWCGSTPTPDVLKHHNAGEPYFQVKLCCKQCGISMSAIASDAECDEASRLNSERIDRGRRPLDFWTMVAHVVVVRRLIPRWNSRTACL